MATVSASMLPSAEYIQQQQSKAYPLPIEPWVAANLSRLWQGMKKHIEVTVSTLATASGTQAQPRSDQSKPASSRSHS
jgi:hypothetical protein